MPAAEYGDRVSVKEYALAMVKRHQDSCEHIDVSKVVSTYKSQNATQDEISNAIQRTHRHNQKLDADGPAMRQKADQAISIIKRAYSLTTADIFGDK